MMDIVSWENIYELTQSYRALGPIIGFLLPFLESFLPFLPLFAFVVANATAYGFWFGFLLSWAGTVAGSYAVFLIIRKFGQARFLNFMTRHKRVQRLIHWVERTGFGPLFLIICFPFTPSALVNLVAGLANIRKHYYLGTLMAGKFVMVFIVTFVGHDIQALFTQPLRTAIVVLLIASLYIGGKILENQMNKKAEAEFRRIRAERSKEQP
ncbi:putative membrane protein YdjX (TVP38/TMEM64 family) [Planomicrobium soli]|uniref:TVP38/TMEM64 family membrane protein n=1 Tax=Planomicrobium soli TaxID=1176648 RepID=A0A2P8G315_9BACL|nr:TVP38/TMEM64 family protein [Planomicrobium soli]PSL28372.1 putative membrane protein YdjX (TVP38/TMEM64 family) [Planomicrobium soli]